MKVPRKDAHYEARVHFGRYTARRLRREGKTGLEVGVMSATEAVLVAARACEDAEALVQVALADRDGIDDDLDDVAKDARAKLAGRGAEAARTAPYTQIFPKGIEYYTAAPLAEEVPRYDELGKRLTENLGPQDPVRVDAVPAIQKGTTAFAAAAKAVETVRTDAALAGTRLAAAEESWYRQIEKTYGALVAEVGRARAERFFPKPGRSRKDGGEEPSRRK